MVINGLFGMKFNEESLSFTPFLPEEIGSIEIKDLAYRNSKLNISIKGKGNTIQSFILDGKKQTNYSIASTINGEHNIVIVLN
jgi:cellobiose phosphorylase